MALMCFFFLGLSVSVGQEFYFPERNAEWNKAVREQFEYNIEKMMANLLAA